MSFRVFRTPRVPLLPTMLLLALLAANPLRAQGGDEGTFQISIDGRPVGTEQFVIRQTGLGANTQFIATGRVQLELPTGTLELVPRLRANGLRAAPATYQVAVRGDEPRLLVGNLRENRFSAKTISPTGEQFREYVASDGALVVDEGIAHHYYFVAQRLRNGTVPILIPREDRQVMATVSDRGEERVDINGTPTELFHLVIRPEGAGERHVWTDALGRVIRVEIPERGYVATRTEIPR